MAVVAGAALAIAALAGCSAPQDNASPAASTQAASSAPAAASSAAATATTTETAPAAASSAKAAPAATSSAPAATTANTANTIDPANVIGNDAARDAALAHAGIALADCTSIEVELDLDDATPHYDVSFKSAGLEYDYDIDPTTGSIIAFGSEVDD